MGQEPIAKTPDREVGHGGEGGGIVGVDDEPGDLVVLVGDQSLGEEHPERQVGEALRRVGLFVNEPGAHQDIMVVGNMRTGLWKKIHGTAPNASVVKLIMGVADDTGR